MEDKSPPGRSDAMPNFGNDRKRLTDKFHEQLILDFISGSLDIDVDYLAMNKAFGKLPDSNILDIFEEFETEWPKDEVEGFVNEIKEKMPDAEITAENIRVFMRNAHIRLRTKMINDNAGNSLRQDEISANSLKAQAISREAKLIRKK